MKKHIAISTFIILLSISTALPSHALADTGQTRSDIRPARDNRQYIGLRQDHHRRNSTGIDVCHIVGRMHIALPPQKHRTRQPTLDTATHTTVTSPADDTPPDADTADTVSDGSGLTATPSEQTVPTELLHKIIDFGLAHSDSHQKISDNLRAPPKNRATPTPTQEKASACSTARQKFSSSFSTRRFYAPTHASSTASTASCCLKRHFHIPHPDSSPPNCAWPRSCASESTTATA